MSDAGIYRQPHLVKRFHEYLRTFWKQVQPAKPTTFVLWVAQVFSERRLLRFYDQNIDGIPLKLSVFSTEVPLPVTPPGPIYVQLHGDINKMVCTKEPTHVFDMDISLMGDEVSLCNLCEDAINHRIRNNDRPRGPAGILKPRMLLYQNGNADGGWDAAAIQAIQNRDLHASPTCLVVAGTVLGIADLVGLVKTYSEIVHRQPGGLVVWISLEEPPTKVAPYFDEILIGPCDEFAELVMKEGVV